MILGGGALDEIKNHTERVAPIHSVYLELIDQSKPNKESWCLIYNSGHRLQLFPPAFGPGENK